MSVLLSVLFGVIALLNPIQSPDFPTLRLKYGDVITLVIEGPRGITSDYPIQSDGAIYAMGVGRVQIGGLTIDEAKKKIETAMRPSYRNPMIQVLLKSQRPDIAYVIGASTSALSITPELDMLKALTQLGVSQEFDLYSIKLYRQGQNMREVDAQALLTGSTTAWNGPILHGDVIVVEPAKYVRVWVLGAIKNPGQLKLREGLNVHQAIAVAGDLLPPRGLKEELSVTIVRGQERINVNPVAAPGEATTILQNNDTVVIEAPKDIRVLVSGEVVEPGEIIVRSGTSLAEAVARAKGANSRGSLRQVYLFRSGEVRVVDAMSVVTGQADSNMLQNGDMVYVPMNQRAVYVFGEVSTPGRKLLPDERDWSLADALDNAGGLLQSGSLRRVTVLRANSEGRFVGAQYNLDEFLKDGRAESNPSVQPGDVIYFGTPKGITISAVTQFVSSVLLIDTIVNRR